MFKQSHALKFTVKNENNLCRVIVENRFTGKTYYSVLCEKSGMKLRRIKSELFLACQTIKEA